MKTYAVALFAASVVLLTQNFQVRANLLVNGSFDDGFSYWILSYGGLVTINDSTTTQQYADGSTGAVGLGAVPLSPKSKGQSVDTRNEAGWNTAHRSR